MTSSLCLMLVCFLGLAVLANCEPKSIEMLMPNVSPKEKDSYLCYSKKIESEEPIFITQFVPHATKNTAHHILMYACEMPGTRDEVWQCGEMNIHGSDKDQYRTGPICRGAQNIIYAWAMDAPALTLPKDVAFELGKSSKKMYLVMQVHYANVDKFLNGATDNSGIVLSGQSEPVSHLAGVYFLVDGGYVRENSKENFEAACEMTEDVEIVPFAYRTHTHKLGKVVSGYLVRNDPILGDVEQTWTEIGRRSPQLPQMFYPIEKNMTITKGDILASRCTIENTRNHPVYIGSTGNDEMCNFYIMYYTKGELLKNNVCFKNGPPNWYFDDFMDSKRNTLQMSKIPSDISTVPAEQIEMLKSEMQMKMNMNMNTNGMDDEESELNELFGEPDRHDQDEETSKKILFILKELMSSRGEK